MHHNFLIHPFKQRHGGLGGGALNVVLSVMSIKVQMEGAGVQKELGRAGKGTGEPRRSRLDHNHWECGALKRF